MIGLDEDGQQPLCVQLLIGKPSRRCLRAFRKWMSRLRLGWSRESRRRVKVWVATRRCSIVRWNAGFLGVGRGWLDRPTPEARNAEFHCRAAGPLFSCLKPSREAPREAHLEIGQIAEDGRERVTVQLVPFHLPSVTSTFVPLLSPPISPSITVITSRCSTPSGNLKISWVQNRLDNIRPPVYGDASLTVNDQPQRERARQPTHGSNAGHGGLQPRS